MLNSNPQKHIELIDHMVTLLCIGTNTCLDVIRDLPGLIDETDPHTLSHLIHDNSCHKRGIVSLKSELQEQIRHHTPFTKADRDRHHSLIEEIAIKKNSIIENIIQITFTVFDYDRIRRLGMNPFHFPIPTALLFLITFFEPLYTDTEQLAYFHAEYKEKDDLFHLNYRAIFSFFRTANINPFALQAELHDLFIDRKAQPTLELLPQIKKLGEGTYGRVDRVFLVTNDGTKPVVRKESTVYDKAGDTDLSIHLREIDFFKRLRKSGITTGFVAEEIIRSDHPPDSVAHYQTRLYTLAEITPLHEAIIACTLTQRYHYASQLLRAILTLHSHGIVHRDLKPANMGITSDKQLRLYDGGSVCLSTPTATRHFSENVSTIWYRHPLLLMAEAYPEIKGSETIHYSPFQQSTTIDYYAVGGILFELIASTYNGEYAPPLCYQNPGDTPVSKERLACFLLFLGYRGKPDYTRHADSAIAISSLAPVTPLKDRIPTLTATQAALPSANLALHSNAHYDSHSLALRPRAREIISHINLFSDDFEQHKRSSLLQRLASVSELPYAKDALGCSESFPKLTLEPPALENSIHALLDPNARLDANHLTKIIEQLATRQPSPP